MRDPHDNHTLDLVEQAKRPLSAAERQRRHREKKKREREEGRRVVMEFTAEEMMLLKSLAGHQATYHEEKHPGSWADRAYMSLWRRMASACRGYDYPGDERWSREALDRDATQVRAALEQLLSGGKPAANPAPVAQMEPAGEGERDYRLSEDEVVSLLTCISAFLTIRSDLNYSLPRKIAEKLAAGTRWAEYGTNIGPDQGVLSILDQLKGEAKRWQKHYDELFDQQRRNAEQAEAIAAQRREAELGPLQRELEALRREKDLLEAERCQAFAAIKVYEQRLRDAGLSTEYR